MKFIKLHTLDSDEFYMNMSKVLSMDRYDKNTTRLHINLNDMTYYECKETPITYPDEDKKGLTAPYPNCMGEMIMYHSGLRYDTDDDYNEFTICNSEEEFKELVLKLI